MKRFFFSLRASYLLFALLALAFGAGNRLAGVDAHKTVFTEMTATHLSRCLMRIAEIPMMLAWLLIFALIGACLFFNTGCCTLSQVRSVRRAALSGKRQRRAVQMALIHIAALMVIGLHALDITMIERHQPVRLYPGHTSHMGGYDVRVKDIVYVTDRSVIMEDENKPTKKRFHIPENAFSLEENFARIQISKKNEPTMTRELRILSPVRLGAAYFFLDGFFITQDSRQIGVMIHQSTNPLAILFFTVYSILFGLFLLRYLTIWSEDPQKKAEDDR